MTIIEILSIGSVVIAGIGLFVAIKSWHKNRVYYDIESTFLRADTINDLRRKLSSGNYTVISAFQDEFKNIRILLGRIKK